MFVVRKVLFANEPLGNEARTKLAFKLLLMGIKQFSSGLPDLVPPENFCNIPFLVRRAIFLPKNRSVRTYICIRVYWLPPWSGRLCPYELGSDTMKGCLGVIIPWMILAGSYCACFS